MIIATSVKNKAVISINDESPDKKFILERRKKGSKEWQVYTNSGFKSYSDVSTEKENNNENNDDEQTSNNINF